MHPIWADILYITDIFWDEIVRILRTDWAQWDIKYRPFATWNDISYMPDKYHRFNKKGVLSENKLNMLGNCQKELFWWHVLF